MRRDFVHVVCGLLSSSLLACTTPPAAPSPLPSPPPSPFADIVGDYRLTIEVGDEQCAAQLPQSLRVRAYDVALVDRGWHFLPVQVVGEDFGELGGEFWPPTTDGRYRFEWNNFDAGGCDYPEQVGATQLYLCGDGFGTKSGSRLSGVMPGGVVLEDGDRRIACGGSHRFTFIRQTP